jgi:hypothetical protein
MQRVSLSSDFFRNDIRSYSNWRQAFWRELFQNSIDQGASAIDIKIATTNTDDPNANCYVVFRDNGPGMTRDVLENVFFAVGATTKSGTGAIGGMGRARILTCFAMKQYAIRSQNYEARGIGGDYEIHDMPYSEGCEVRVHMDGCDVAQAKRYLDAFLVESRFSANVTLNGLPITVNSGHLGRPVRDLLTEDGNIFARVYFNKSLPTKKLLVRVNGVSMFSDSTEVNGQVVVELLAEGSREMLTANRDSLRYDYSRPLSLFMQELAADNKSAVRDRKRRQTTIASGGGMLSARRRPKPKATHERPTDAEYVPASRVGVGAQQQAAAFAALDADRPYVTNYQELDDRSVFTRWLHDTFGDIFVFDETDSAAMRKSIAQYLPQNWQEQYLGGGRYTRRGGNVVKVLLAWKIVCEYALEIYMDFYHVDHLSWGVGFTFSDAPADHRELRDGHVLSLRPVNEEGKLDFALTDRADLLRLMSMGKHEVAHVRHSWHNESYAATREMIDARFDQAECLRRIREAVKGVPEV